MSQWPEVFTNKDFSYTDDVSGYDSALSDGLIGWGLCKAGNEPNDQFGHGMVKIARLLNISGSPESIDRLAAEIIKSRS